MKTRENKRKQENSFSKLKNTKNIVDTEYWLCYYN